MGSGEAAAAREALVTRVRPLAAQLLVLLHGGGGIMIYTDIRIIQTSMSGLVWNSLEQ